MLNADHWRSFDRLINRFKAIVNDDRPKFTRFMLAVFLNKNEESYRSVKECMDVLNMQSIGLQETGLMHICCNKNKKLLNLIFSIENLKFDPNIRAKNGWTALNLCCKYNFEPGVSKLLQIGCNINIPDTGGTTPIMWACYNGNYEIIKMLLECPDCDVNMYNCKNKSEYKITPYNAVLLAIEMGHTGIIKLLFERDKIDLVNISNSISDLQGFEFDIYSQIKILNCEGCTGILGWIGRIINTEERLDLVKDFYFYLDKIPNSDFEKLVIESEVPRNPSPNKKSLLMTAAIENDFNLFKFLVDNGVSPCDKFSSKINTEQEHPLGIFIFRHQNKEAVDYILDNDDSLESYSIYSHPFLVWHNPLALAIRVENIDIVKLLLEKGDCPINRPHQGISLWLYSIYIKNIDIVKTIITYVNDLDKLLPSGFGDLKLSTKSLQVTPLMVAAETDNITMVSYLLWCGSNPNIKCKGGILDGSTASKFTDSKTIQKMLHDVSYAHEEDFTQNKKRKY